MLASSQITKPTKPTGYRLNFLIGVGFIHIKVFPPSQTFGQVPPRLQSALRELGAIVKPNTCCIWNTLIGWNEGRTHSKAHVWPMIHWHLFAHLPWVTFFFFEISDFNSEYCHVEDTNRIDPYNLSNIQRHLCDLCHLFNPLFGNRPYEELTSDQPKPAIHHSK